MFTSDYCSEIVVNKEVTPASVGELAYHTCMLPKGHGFNTQQDGIAKIKLTLAGRSIKPKMGTRNNVLEK